MKQCDFRRVKQALETGDALLVDVRSSDIFTGRVAPIDLPGGHIPGSINIPMGKIELDPDGVKAELEDAGADKPVILYCNHGSLSTRSAAALAAGVLPEERILNYKGSVADWLARGGELTTD